MASRVSVLSSCMLLSVFLAIASSSADYGYVPTPDLQKPNPQDKPLPTNPGYGDKPKTEEKDKPLPTNAGYEKPNPEVKDKPVAPTNPSYGEKPKAGEKLEETLTTTIAVQGLVLCQSGSTYFPIQGAMARVTCLAVDEQGYESAPFSILSHITDSKGYFIATVSPSELEENWKITECKCFLENSSLEGCNIPTDVNNGITGALLSKYRSLANQKLRLYSVGPFIYTTESKVPVRNGF